MQETAEGTDMSFPVDDATYDLLQSLTSKLEALDAYRNYIEDGDEQSRSLYQELFNEDKQHAQRLYDVLRQRISGS